MIRVSCGYTTCRYANLHTVATVTESRVVTRYVGSGIKGVASEIRRVGSGIKNVGSGITA